MGRNEEVQSCMLDLTGYLLVPYSNSSICKVDMLISVVCIKEFDLRTFEEHVSGVADCSDTTNLAYSWYLVIAEFEKDLNK